MEGYAASLSSSQGRSELHFLNPKPYYFDQI